MNSAKTFLLVTFGFLIAASLSAAAGDVPSKTPCAKLLSGKSVVLARTGDYQPPVITSETGKLYVPVTEYSEGKASAGKIIRFDLKTKRKTEVDLPEGLAGKNFYADIFGEGDASYFVIASNWTGAGGKVKTATFIFDPRTESFLRVKSGENYFVPYNGCTSHFTLFGKGAGADFVIVDVRTGSERKISFDSTPVLSGEIVPGQDKAMFFFKGGEVRVVDYATGEIKTSKMPLPKPSGSNDENIRRFSDFRQVMPIDEHRYLEIYYDTATPAGNDGMFNVTMKHWVGDLRTGAVSEIKELSSITNIWPAGKRLVYGWGENREGNILFDLGTMKPIATKYKSMHPNTAGDWVLVNSSDSDLKKRSVSVFRVGSEPVELPELNDYNSFYQFMPGVKSVSPADSYIYISGRATSAEGTQRIYRYHIAERRLEALAIPYFYKEPSLVSGDHLIATVGGELRYLKIAEWKPAASVPPEPQAAGARFYEEPFEIGKYRDMDIGARAGDVIEYFDREAYRRHPRWALPLLLRVLKGADILFGSLLEKYPYLTTEEFANILVSQSYSEELIREYLPLVKKHAETLKRLIPDSSRAVEAMWKSLVPLRPIVVRLDKTYREELSLYIARGLANSAVEGEYRAILQAKLVKFARQMARRWLGVETRALTDLSVVNEKGTLTPVILGVYPIDGDPATHTPYGFFAKKLEQFKIENDGEGVARAIDKTFGWKHGGQTFTAKYAAKPILKNTLEFSPKLTSPDYPSLWKDGSLNGLVIVGDNLKFDEDMILHEYITYYQKQGFRFDKKTVNVDDMAVYLKEEIESGRLDYMLKEAHSDGDDQNVFRYVLKAKVMVGRKTHSDGRTETIHIVDNVAPKEAGKDAGESGSALIPNAEFGSWIRARESGGFGEFIYFNTSCGATVKVANEIQSAYSPKLLDLGGVSSMNTFVSTPGEVGMYAVLDGIRKGKTFQRIRDDLGKCKEYLNGYDRYVFPDDAEFDKEIRSQIMLPLDVDLKIFGPDGKPFEIDNAPVVPPGE
ncbi:MAG: hypothetical protein HYW49_03110 [Deltaproteobacteria bacterium]|nr:hypothetical protein [Deltaproteobacteria bacterium]